MDENGFLIYALHEELESMDEEGNYQITEGESLYFLVKEAERTTNEIEYAFYSYDQENKAAGSIPLAYETVDTLPFRLGERISNVPFGIPVDDSTQLNNYITAILPLSVRNKGENLTLSVSVADIPNYYAAKSFHRYCDVSSKVRRCCQWVEGKQGLRGHLSTGSKPDERTPMMLKSVSHSLRWSTPLRW